MNRIRRRNHATSPLAHSVLKVEIVDLLAEYELRHSFRNEGDSAIEAVYSFPVPLDAAFCGMQATLGDESLVAQVLPAEQANRRYDDAISDGHAAILLEQVERGMLCVNLGNLKPGEQGEIVLRFSAMLNVADGVARFSLPLVHRPRYGRMRLDEVVEPQHDFMAEHPLDAEIRVRGLLAGRPVRCAMEGARFEQQQDETVLRIGKAMLDRDLVLNFELGNAPLAQARLVDDDDGSIAMMTFTIPQVAIAAEGAREICLLLDGSGSMSGDAIVQSRQALAAVVDALEDTDRIQVIRFGSRAIPMFRRPLRALPRVKSALHELIATIDADLGGTEMDEALMLALDSLASTDGEPGGKAVILVTDGAVSAQELAHASRRAAEMGIRVFVVAVGSSAGVDVLAPLAEETHATLERAVPAEPIDAGVMRQFRRVRAAPVKVEVNWEGADVQALPLGATYPGDAVTAIAFAKDKKPRKATVRTAGEVAFELEFGQVQSMPSMRVWAGQQAYSHAAKADRETLALRYGLVSPETKAVLVKLRGDHELAEGLPRVTPVRHMLPQGMLVAGMSLRALPGLSYGLEKMEAYDMAPGDSTIDRMDLPSFLRRSVQDDPVVMEVAEHPEAESATRDSLSIHQADKQSVLQALLALLLTEGRIPSIDAVVAQLEPRLRPLARAWLEFHHFDDMAEGALLTLLHDARLDLSDEQEAELAMVLGGRSLSNP